MGSRVMHYCIASIINQSLDMDENAFFLGSLAPDLHSYMGPNQYYVTHFAEKNEQGKTYTKYPEYIHKYLSDEASPFHLGYYFHLIADDIWKREIYYKNIKTLDLSMRQEVLQQNYRDFRRLNGKIIQRYALALPNLQPVAVVMDEIDTAYFPQLIQALQRDFRLKDVTKGEELEFLHLHQVLDVLTTSVQECLEAYAALQSNVGN